MASKRDLMRLLDGVPFEPSEFEKKIEELEKQRTTVITKVRQEMADHINKKSPLWTATVEGLAEYHVITINNTPEKKGHCGCPDTRVTLHAYRIPEYVKLTKEIDRVREESHAARNAHYAKVNTIRRSLMIDGATPENVAAVAKLIRK